MDISFTALLILQHIDRCKKAKTKIRFSSIADSVCMHRNTVEKRISELNQKGLIEIAREKRGQPYNISIKPAGKQVLIEWLQ
jgi:DNA-binding IscR family transcriptional regulator